MGKEGLKWLNCVKKCDVKKIWIILQKYGIDWDIEHNIT